MTCLQASDFPPPPLPKGPERRFGVFHPSLPCLFLPPAADLTHLIHILDTEHPWDVYSINSGHVEIVTCLEWDQSGRSPG